MSVFERQAQRFEERAGKRSTHHPAALGALFIEPLKYVCAVVLQFTLPSVTMLELTDLDRFARKPSGKLQGGQSCIPLNPTRTYLTVKSKSCLSVRVRITSGYLGPC